MNIDWNVSGYENFITDRFAVKSFKQGGGDLPGMLRNQMNGVIDSWAIRAAFHQFVTKQYTVYPVTSKVNNIGIGVNATHTKSGDRFKTSLDVSKRVEFLLDNTIKIDENIMKEFRKQFSMKMRITDKLKSYFRFK